MARPAPRITLNKLGEYLVATAGRRRSIIEDQRDPKTFKVAQYDPATDAIVAALCACDISSVHRKIEQLQQARATNEFQAKRNARNVEALLSYMKVHDQLVDDEHVVASGVRSRATLLISGVTVSIRPEVILRDRRTEEVIGLLKLYFSKTHPLGSGAPYVTTGLYRFLEDAWSTRVSEKLVKTLDVFACALSVAPRARARRNQDLDAACREIFVGWTA